MGAIGVKKVVLDDGRELSIDLRVVTMKEFRFATNKDSAEDKSDQIVAKACGLSDMEFAKISQPDYRRIIGAFWDAAIQPIKEITTPQELANQYSVADLREALRLAESYVPNEASEPTA